MTAPHRNRPDVIRIETDHKKAMLDQHQALVIGGLLVVLVPVVVGILVWLAMRSSS